MHKTPTRERTMKVNSLESGSQLEVGTRSRSGRCTRQVDKDGDLDNLKSKAALY